MQINDQRRRPLVQALRRRRSLQAGLIQLLYVAAGVGLGLLVPTLDVGAQIPSGEAVALLAGITAGMLAVTGIVYALLFLVVQFAATSQSPRLHLFRDNQLVWHALGLVVGVIVYAATCGVVAAGQATITVLVPITVIIVVLAALAITRQLQMAALRSLQLSAALDQVTTRTRTVIDGLYTAPFPQPEQPPPVQPEHPVQIHWPAHQKVLRQIDMPKLIRLARQADATVRLRLMPGDLVNENAVVMEIWNPAAAPDPRPFLKCLEVGIDRNFTQDPFFGFRLLNDIALRAMSAATNDPASAVQAIDCVESLLLALAPRDLAIGVIVDDTTTPRVVFDARDWEEFLAAGTDEIAETRMHPMIQRRLRMMLEHLIAVAPPARRTCIEQRIADLDRADR